MPDAPIDLAPDVGPDVVQPTVSQSNMPDWDYIFGTLTLSLETPINTMSVLDSRYIHIPLLSCIDNMSGVPQDATTLQSKIALVTTAPQLADFQSADWIPYTGGQQQIAPLFSRLGVGAIFSNALAAGTYTVYVMTNNTVQVTGTLVIA